MTKAIKPVSPKDVAKVKLRAIPGGVIQAFNELIREHFKDNISYFTLSSVAERAAKYTGLTREAMFEKGYFDVEPLFEQSGWTVRFEKADRGEQESYFTFTKRRK